MRISNDSLSLSGVKISESPADMGISFETDPLWLGHISQYSIQLFFEGTPNGVWRLEASNDKGAEDKSQGGFSSLGVENWIIVADSDQAIVEAGSHGWDVRDCGYRWVRVVYQRVSGTGSLTAAVFNAKGV